MIKAVIVSAVRSAVGRYAGELSEIEPYKLAGKVIKEAVKRSTVDPNDIEDVIMGNLYGQHGNIARVAMLEAGLPETTSAYTLDRQCGSSIETIHNAAMNIELGYGDVYVACGLEHMTKEPWQLEKTSKPYSIVGPSAMRTRLTPEDDGSDRVGMTAEKVAKLYKQTPEELDLFAYNSHKKATNAINNGYFKDEILPIEVPVKRGSKIVDQDENVRMNQELEDLAKLRPAFIQDGIVTAGNSCPNSDGASAVVLMSEEKAKELGVEILATVIGYGVSGLDPSVMGLGPTKAVPKALKRAGITIEDVDVMELNEAFASQVIASIQDLGIDPSKVNPNGGAIAIGHPLGATGGVLTAKLVHDMKRRDLRYGVVTMCIGGGQGAALVLERE
ncbi:thiolase family protein [Fundicoccus culcitae]|uniref:acetyl-CoA C-acyltransferase n=1 Tax=Fundicoccus culcitae TaxID=2969821 RepID=A0ABY5P863_9LACT|nr:thiolase family protein [Fundicoccus culcitae]UUX34709.1 thiolase family protein [Fundicoccus culcitae]